MYGAAEVGAPAEASAPPCERRTARRRGLAIASVVLGVVAVAAFRRTRGGAAPSVQLHAVADTTTAPAIKVVYGNMSQDKVKALFEKFKSDEKKSYESDDEESRRFKVFKENLVFIDKVRVHRSPCRAIPLPPRYPRCCG